MAADLPSEFSVTISPTVNMRLLSNTPFQWSDGFCFDPLEFKIRNGMNPSGGIALPFDPDDPLNPCSPHAPVREAFTSERALPIVDRSDLRVSRN